ncbi:hypothetical protein GCM10020256_39070 [Streptomyces thermocoprophilus]
MAARRTEEVLRAALGVPDRIPYADKRAVRDALPATEAERAAEIAELHARAGALAGWPESLTPEPFRPVDHVRAFGLDGAPAAVGEFTELVPGGAVRGQLVAAAGPDLHLRTEDGDVVVLDSRLMTGWGGSSRRRAVTGCPLSPYARSRAGPLMRRTSCSETPDARRPTPDARRAMSDVPRPMPDVRCRPVPPRPAERPTLYAP